MITDILYYDDASHLGDNWKGPGWYFYDVSFKVRGPFESKLEAEDRALWINEVDNFLSTDCTNMLIHKYRDKLCLALDVYNAVQALKLIKETNEVIRSYKIGMQLFYSQGTEFFNLVDAHSKDLKIDNLILDLKLHDIPNTNINALKGLKSKYKFTHITVHLGDDMSSLPLLYNVANDLDIRLLGVSVLTSTSKESVDYLYNTNIKEVFTSRVLTAWNSVHGFISSGLDLKIIASINNESYDKKLVYVPGIRYGYSNDDQKRAVTPKYALKNGADMVILGRIITQSKCISNSLHTLLESLR